MVVYLTTRGWTLLFISLVSTLVSFALMEPVYLAAGLAGLGAVIASYFDAKRGRALIEGARVSRNARIVRTYEGGKVEMALKIDMNSPTPSDLSGKILVAEKLPPRVEPESDDLVEARQADRGFAAAYTLKPWMGKNSLSDIEILYLAPLGLSVATRIVSEPAIIYTYPNPNIEAYTRARLSFHHGSSRPVNRRWPLGSEFLELREYVEGDDPRLIHWPSTARLGQLVVREHALESRVNTHVVLDHSLDMWVGTPGHAPIDHGGRTALSLASIAFESGGTFGLHLFDGWKCHYAVKPYSATLSEIYTVLSTLEPGYGRSPAELKKCIRMASSHAEGKALVVISGPGRGVRELASSFQSLLPAVHPLKMLILHPPTGSTPEEAAVRQLILSQTAQLRNPSFYVVQWPDSLFKFITLSEVLVI